MNELEWFINVSKSLGNDRGLVQGTGGNISVKTGKEMIIKSSGIRLDSVKIGHGYSVVDYENISNMYSGGLSEKNAGRAVMDSLIRGKKPSIETAFHSFLGKYVIHLHPASMNVILCSARSRQILSEIFKDFLWVPYFKVGHVLATEIKKRAAHDKLIFMENHGIVISSDSADECINILDDARRNVEDYLRSKMPGFSSFVYSGISKSQGGFINSSAEAVRDRDSLFSQFLFPDAAVFSSSDKIKVDEKGIHYFMDYENALNVDEVLSAHIYIKEMTEKLFEPKYLKKNEVADILGMESEKYRRRLVGL